MMATSVAIAIVLWFVISIAIYPTTPRTLHHVPLKVEIAGTSAEENGLSVIDYDVQDVTVQIGHTTRPATRQEAFTAFVIFFGLVGICAGGFFVLCRETSSYKKESLQQ